MRNTSGAVVVLTALCAVTYLPGLASIPPIDRDEARFAQATKQMLETGDFVGIYFQETPRNKKPVGIHWLQAASVKLLGGGPSTKIWLYRVPSVLGAWLAVLFTLAAGRVLFDPKAALAGAALLAVCVGLVVEAHLATTDAVLLATVTAVQWILARAYLGARAQPLPWREIVLFWSALGIGVLVKGPIGFVVTALTALALALWDSPRWLRALRPAAGLIVLAAWVLPWFLAVTFLTETGFVSQAVSEDLWAKVLGGQESHGAPPGYHLAVLALFFWPASLFVVPALVAAWRARTQPAVRFCLAWAVPTWVLFELVPTKLPHYVLPAYPALTLLIGATLTGAIAADYATRLARRMALVWIVVTLLLSLAVLGGSLLGDGSRWWALLGAATLAFTAVVAGDLMLRRRARQSMIAAIACGAVAVACLAGIYVPRLQRLWISSAIATAIERETGETPPLVISSGIHEPSLVFLLGTRTRLTDPSEAARVAIAEPESIVVLGPHGKTAFLEEVARAGARAEPLGVVNGLNYSKGRPVHLSLLRVRCLH